MLNLHFEIASTGRQLFAIPNKIERWYRGETVAV